jgi:DNA-binding transcriptional MerR regulator
MSGILSPSQAAEQSGFSLDTLRYYERLSLLTEHDARVQDRITLLRAQRKHLQEKIDWYRSQLPAAAHS